MKITLRGRSLEERIESEEEYHDLKYDTKGRHLKHYDYCPTYIIFRDMLLNIGSLRDKKLVEYGCGTGWITQELASLGGEIQAFDISSSAVRETLLLLGGRSGCCVRQMNAESLDYHDGYFDIAFGFAILHHLELSVALREMHRILKPGGIGYFAEPLGYNPLINFFRFLTPGYRTRDELPIRFECFMDNSSCFTGFSHREYYLTALIPFLFLYIPGMGVLFNKSVAFFMKIDSYILTKFPSLGRWAWYSVIVLKK